MALEALGMVETRGLVAAIAAHWLFVLYTFAFGTPTTFEGGADRYTTAPVIIEYVGENQVRVGDRVFTDEAGDTPEEEGSAILPAPRTVSEGTRASSPIRHPSQRMASFTEAPSFNSAFSITKAPDTRLPFER